MDETTTTLTGGDANEQVERPMRESEKLSSVSELLQAVDAVDVTDPNGYRLPLGGDRQPQTQPAAPQAQPGVQAASQTQEILQQSQDGPSGDYGVVGPDPLPMQLQAVGQQYLDAVAQLQVQEQQIQQLAQIDPGRAALAMQHFNAQVAQLQRFGAQVAQAQQAFHQQAHVGYRERLGARIVELIPAWKDGGVREREKAELRRFLRSRDYSDAEISQIQDPRVVRDLYDMYQATRSPGSKPGARRLKAGRKRDLDRLVQRAIRKATGPGAPRHDPTRAVSALLASL